jgi:hypothetical protein
MGRRGHCAGRPRRRRPPRSPGRPPSPLADEVAPVGSALDGPLRRRDDAAVRWTCAAEVSVRGWTPHPALIRKWPRCRISEAAGAFPPGRLSVRQRVPWRRSTAIGMWHGDCWVVATEQRAAAPELAPARPCRLPGIRSPSAAGPSLLEPEVGSRRPSCAARIRRSPPALATARPARAQPIRPSGCFRSRSAGRAPQRCRLPMRTENRRRAR